MNVRKTSILVLLGAVLLGQVVFAQVSQTSQKSWRRGTAIVLFSGVGGGILGLSTLSFYGDPHERTGNITTGALLGVAAGLGYVLLEPSTSSRSDSWVLGPRPDGLNFGYHRSF